MTGEQTYDWCVQDVWWLYIIGVGFYVWGNFQLTGVTRMNMGMIVEVYRMRTFGACVCHGMDTFPDHVWSYVGNRISRFKVSRPGISAYFWWCKTNEWPWNFVLDYIICGSKFGMWIHTEGSHSELLLNRILSSSAFFNRDSLCPHQFEMQISKAT
jgi:hypothetical protein